MQQGMIFGGILYNPLFVALPFWISAEEKNIPSRSLSYFFFDLVDDNSTHFALFQIGMILEKELRFSTHVRAITTKNFEFGNKLV